MNELKCYRCGAWPCTCADGQTIIHGDCLTVGSLLDTGYFATILSDPPYSSGARQSAQIRSRKGMRRDEGPHGKWIDGDNLTAHGFAMLIRLVSVELLRLGSSGAHWFCFIDWRQWPVMAMSIDSSGWSVRACLVWDKISFGMGNGFRQQAEFVLHASRGTADNFVRHDIGTVFRYPRDRDDTHPTMKPLGMVRDILSAVPDGPVLDPFLGSGTTLLACKSIRRRGIGIEIDERYCEVAANRLQQNMLDFGGDAE